jgi:predicted GNAT family N-acyltransferase
MARGGIVSPASWNSRAMVRMAGTLPVRAAFGNGPGLGVCYVEVRRPQSDEEFARLYRLRWQVLRAPWGEPPGSERDATDADSEHALIQSPDGEPLAAGRLHFNSSDEAQIRYMAVAELARGQGLGRQIVEYLETIARDRGATTVVLNAREEVAGFYQTMDYEIIGAGPTMFGTVRHVRMQKRL